MIDIGHDIRGCLRYRGYSTRHNLADSVPVSHLARIYEISILNCQSHDLTQGAILRNDTNDNCEVIMPSIKYPAKWKDHVNPVPHMPISNASNSAANKNMMSKILTNGDTIPD